MTPLLRETITQTIGRILGEAAFIFTDVLDNKLKPAAAEWDGDGVSLSFTGTPSGELRMWVGSGFACITAANMLGIDTGSEEARSKGLDALKELLNMIVGNFITEAYGETPVFVLGLPTSIPSDRKEHDVDNSEAIWFEAEGNIIMFLVHIA